VTLYMLSVYPDDAVMGRLSEEEMQKAFEATDVFNRSLDAAGAFVFGGGLHPADTATVVNNIEGDNLVTDGPFAEAKESVGGFWIISAADLDEALRWAAEGSRACQGRVEVRPFADGGTSADMGG
jgi:hypothetical protein